MKKRAKVDGTFRKGGETVIPDGNKGGGVGEHAMSAPLTRVNRVPNDVGDYDQHHGNANDCLGDGE
jgi:hypothetical protein